jgi:hypothetical protein
MLEQILAAILPPRLYILQDKFVDTVNRVSLGSSKVQQVETTAFVMSNNTIDREINLITKKIVPIPLMHAVVDLRATDIFVTRLQHLSVQIEERKMGPKTTLAEAKSIYAYEDTIKYDLTKPDSIDSLSSSLSDAYIFKRKSIHIDNVEFIIEITWVIYNGKPNISSINYIGL